MSTGVLTSYWYFKTYDFSRLPAACPLILDSGAFSAYTSGGEVRIEEFSEWLTEVGQQRPYDFAFTLDVLGDHAASLANWQWLRDQGHVTMPVIHYGQRADEVLPDYLAQGVDHIALGGLASGGATPQVKGWIAHVFRWLRSNAPEMRTHGLGIHMRSALARFPWTTTDSSRFGTAWRFANLNLWDPYKRRWFSVHLNGREAFKHGRALRAYGVEPSEIALAGKDNYLPLVRLATRIECRDAEDFDASLRRAAAPYLAIGGLRESVGQLDAAASALAEVYGDHDLARRALETAQQRAAEARSRRYLVTRGGEDALGEAADSIERRGAQPRNADSEVARYLVDTGSAHPLDVARATLEVSSETLSG